MTGIAVDGVQLDPPMSLTYEEVGELAEYNTGTSKGQAFTPDTVAHMKQLQLRFDWLGYCSGDGVHHGGTRTRPLVVTVQPESKRWWLSSLKGIR